MSRPPPTPLSPEAVLCSYRGFLDLFNHGKFFEAHEVLEAVWLGVRREPVADFYKGLIQLAGAFVHVQKRRFAPALSLLRLAEQNLGKFPGQFEHLNVNAVREIIKSWQAKLTQIEAEREIVDLPNFPTLNLME